MKKCEYIEKLANLVANRVKYHAPIVKDGEIDYSILKAINIDLSLPIFVFEKSVDEIYYKAFCKAKERCKFNLILTQKSKISMHKLLALKNTLFLPEQEIGNNLLNTIKSLNINYVSTTNFDLVRKREYVKIDEEEIEFDFLPFYRHKKLMKNGVLAEVKQFLLNGKNFVVDVVNSRDVNNEISFEINLPLPQGYYSFKKTFDHVEVNNLTSKERAYFNYFVKDADVEFSCIDGIESCTFACVHVTGKISLKPKQKRSLFFNLGKEKFNLISLKDINDFFAKSQQQMYDVFDVRVTSKSTEFDREFNNNLPKRIWDSWNNFTNDENAEEKWLNLRNSIVKEKVNGFEICSDKVRLKEVQIFNKKDWKRIFIMYGESNYLFAGKVKYYNFTLLPKQIFDKNNEIYLSFAM